MSITSLFWKSLANGVFNVASNWTPSAPTGGPNATDNVTLSAAFTPYTVTSSASATVNGLTVYVGATLDVTAGAFMVNSFATNLGAIDVSAGSLTLKSGVAGITNTGAGLIEATGTGAMSVTGTGPIVNDGVIEANGTGALTIGGGAKITGLGDVKAFAPGSRIVLNGGSIVSNGSVSTIAATKTAAGSSIVAAGADALEATSIQNAGTLTLANGSTVTMAGALSNGGVTNIGQTVAQIAGAATLKIAAGGLWLTGGGNVDLTDNAANRIVSAGVATNFNNVNNAITGSGVIGDALLRVANDQGGIINANGLKGLTLNGDTTASLGDAYNAGLIEATNAIGALALTGAWDNAGVIQAVTGNVLLQNFTDAVGGGTIATTKIGDALQLSNATITGGVVTIHSGSSVFTSVGTVNTLPAAVSNAGTIKVVSSTLILGAYLFNAGAVTVSGAKGQLELGSATGSTVLKSGGVVNLASGGSILGVGANETLVNVNDTISGDGSIRAAGASHLTLENNADGAIVGTNATSALTINTGANTILNAGTIESSAAGGVVMTGALYNSGTLYTKAGRLDVVGAVTGMGLANIGGTGEIEFGSASSSIVDFLAASTGELKLDTSTALGHHFTGEILGFGVTDKIDFADISATGAKDSIVAAAGGFNVTFTDGTHASTLFFAGLTPPSFALHNDGAGHLLVT